MRDANSVYTELFEAIRTRDRADVDAIVQQIRSGADADTTLKRIRNGDLLLQLSLAPETKYRYDFPYLREIPSYLLTSDNPYTNTFVHEYSFGQEQKSRDQAALGSLNTNRYGGTYWTPYHVAELVDPNLEVVKPSLWTTASSDDALMRKLLRLYFIREYHTGPFFQKDYFLEDMAAGRNQYCSSLLVNAVLTYACHSYDGDKHRAEFWNANTLAYQFFAETRRLLDLEILKPKLTTIQAMLLLHILANINGTDGVGYALFFTRAVAMARSLRLFERSATANQKEQDARDFTAWALYGHQGVMAYEHKVSPLITVPPENPLPDSTARPEWYGKIMYRFPGATTLYSAYFGHLFKAKVQLWSIASRLATQYCKEGTNLSELSVSDVKLFYAKLMRWRQALPEPLKPDRITSPYHLQLHMFFQYYMINLLEEPIATRLDDPEHVDSVVKSLGGRPREILADAKRHFETIMRIYYLRHSFEALDCMLIHFLSLFAFMARAAIQAGVSKDHLQALQSNIVLATKGLRDQSHSHYVGRMVFYAVRGVMRPEDIVLIDRFTGQGRVHESHPPKDWQSHSTWALGSGSVADDREANNLTKLFEETRIIDGEEAAASDVGKS